MLVAGLLLALRLGACEDIAGYTHRVHLDPGDEVKVGTWTLGNPDISVELCAREHNTDNVYNATNDVYIGRTARDACLVSDAYKCCFTFVATMCTNLSRDQCAETFLQQWCDDTPAEPAPQVAGIAVGVVAFVVLMSATATM